MTTSEQMELMELKNRMDTLEKLYVELLGATTVLSNSMDGLMESLDDVTNLLKEEQSARNIERKIYLN